MQIQIHYTRLHGKPLTIHTEDLISDNGLRLKTHFVVPNEYRQPFSEGWWQTGQITPGRYIATIIKYYFYNEWFDILELRDDDNELLGYYSDISTPLTKTGDGLYALTDLALDLWLGADGVVKELDWDEFEEICQHNLITLHRQTQAKQTLSRLVSEAAQNIYPTQYIT
jgi:Protein of unknown function (DUF402)